MAAVNAWPFYNFALHSWHSCLIGVLLKWLIVINVVILRNDKDSLNADGELDIVVGTKDFLEKVYVTMHIENGAHHLNWHTADPRSNSFR